MEKPNETRRNHLNKLWFLRGWGVLKHNDEPAFRWFYDDDAIDAGTGRIRRKTILAELGRLDDDDLILQLARVLCEQKPPMREAIAMIRRHRLGRLASGSCLDLTVAIMTAINDYVAAHETTELQVLTALENAADEWRRDDEGDED